MAFLTDTFTDADNTDVINHTPETGGAWVRHPLEARQVIILSNRAQNAADNIVSLHYNNITPPSAEYDVELDVYYAHAPSQGISIYGPLGRLSSTAKTYYGVRYVTTFGNWQLVKCVTGTVTLLASSESYPLTPGTTYKVRLHMTDTIKQVYVNDVLQCEHTDNAITDAGYPGFRLNIYGTGNKDVFQVDRFEAFVPGAPQTGASMYVWNGSQWVKGELKRYDGSQWVAAPLKRWNGSEWVDCPPF